MLSHFFWHTQKQRSETLSTQQTEKRPFHDHLHLFTAELLSCRFSQPHLTESIVNLPIERIETVILFIRGEKAILDSDLAALYSTKRLNEQVRRNRERFPEDFMFQLTAEESETLRSQIATSRSHGGRRYLPYAFTEHGAIMVANVLNSERAVQSSVQVVRAFVRLRRMLASNAELARKLAELEGKYDSQFKIVFEALRQLMTPTPTKAKPIGFRPKALKK